MAPIKYSYDHVYGAFVGAAVGDAAGATLEFFRGGKITENIAKNAMTMPGGGMLRVAPGQITDDTELALAMTSALVPVPPSSGFPTDAVATAYIDWYKSRPFDIGGTCAKAFGCYKSYKPTLGISISQYMQNTAMEHSQHSEANGALMRATPLSIWACQMPLDIVAEYARLDAKLSHPNKVCQDCNAVYCMAQVYLMNHPGDAEGAIEMIERYVTNNSVDQRVHDWVLVDSKLPFTQFGKDVSHNIGWVKHAFTLAIYFLRNKTDFPTAIMKTLTLGGDTDTNACIVGGLMGAYWGEAKIPLSMKLPVLEFDCSKVNIKDDIGFAMKNTVVPRTKPNAPWDDIGYNRPVVYATVNLYQKVNGLLGLQQTLEYGFRDTKTYLEDAVVRAQ
jgi:ADP-ribosylglycohydrolase